MSKANQAFLDLCNELHELADRYMYDCASNARCVMTPEAIETLCRITIEEVEELDHIKGYCVGSPVLLACGKDEFYRVMDILQDRLPKDIFEWVIDYNCDRSDGTHPLHCGEFDLDEYFDVCDMYYDSQYDMIYGLAMYADPPTYAHAIICDDKENGMQQILDAVAPHCPTKKEFDPEELQYIWDDYHADDSDDNGQA